MNPLYPQGAAIDLGLGGALRDQVKDETDEERKRRLRMQQQSKLLSGNASMDLLGGPDGASSY